MPDLIVLKEYIDLGGVFILALVLMWGFGRKLDRISTTLTKVLTLLVVVTQRVGKFNHLDEVLTGNSKEVGKILDKVANGNK